MDTFGINLDDAADIFEASTDRFAKQSKVNYTNEIIDFEEGSGNVLTNFLKDIKDSSNLDLNSSGKQISYNAEEVGKSDDSLNLDSSETADAVIANKKRKLHNDIFEKCIDEATDKRIVIHLVESMEACQHEVAIPPGINFLPLERKGTGEPAKTYPFILDPFQKEAILCLDNNQSVLVAAHTSAGKTVVAEYAIAMCLRDKRRVIYTTPIKALSNQKYREFFELFQDVGLMTGDVTLNPNASCLIMTTEILQSMLYRGSEITREVGWVIFDEIHYMRDKERGRVWEETIILLPDSVHFVFLSATIPNARQFAEWVAYLHHQPCNVVYTDYRPVPLQHYIFPAGGDGLHLVVDEKCQFREESFNAAMKTLQDAPGGGGGRGNKSDMQQRGRKGGFVNPETNCFKIVKLIMERDLQPLIVFSFSKKECEIYALQMAKLSFNNGEEKEMVETVFNSAMECLTDEDRKLPQVESVLPLLKKGIGIHHSGLLPILKETVEILFGEGLIKCLFATETFAMGLNMPARTVLFTSARKFDGKDYRWISSGEYVQMAGRAGRRGKDLLGTVILMVDETMKPTECKRIVLGQPDPLNSAYYLTYNMVVNLLRVEGINPEFILEKSFFQFQNFAMIPEIMQRKEKLKFEYDSIEIEDEEGVASYYQIKQQLDALLNQQWSTMQKPTYMVPFMQSGRVVHVIMPSTQDDYGWGVVINCTKKTVKNNANSTGFYVVDVLLKVATRRGGGDKGATGGLNFAPFPDATEFDILESKTADVEVVSVKLDLIRGLSAVRLYIPQDLISQEKRISVMKSLEKAMQKFGDAGLPLIDPISDMKIKSQEFKEVLQKVSAFEERLQVHWLHDDPKLKDLYSRYADKQIILTQIHGVNKEIGDKKKLLQMDELKCRKRVLRRLGYCTPDDVVELKGRVACEITGADELVLTELLFDGVFSDLSSQQICALLSCFVFEEKAPEMPSLTEELSGPLRNLQHTARRIAKVCKECKMDIDEETYVDSFKPHMMDIASAWCGGATFGHICKMTDIFEGSIIRCMRLLEEVLRQMCCAAKAIGNVELEAKFSKAITEIKRDIVFAASLYL